MTIRAYLAPRWLRWSRRARAAFWLSVRTELQIVRAKQHPVHCSWCGRRMCFGNPALPVSHGRCPDCNQRLWSQLAARITAQREGVNRSELAARTLRQTPRPTLSFHLLLPPSA